MSYTKIESPVAPKLRKEEYRYCVASFSMDAILSRSLYISKSIYFPGAGHRKESGACGFRSLGEDAALALRV